MSHGAVSPQLGDSSVKPVFGFVLLGGALTGARVRDVYLMNELVRRGYRCHVWWAHERDRDAGIHPEITQSWLFHHARYAGYVQWIVGKSIGRPIDDWLGHLVSFLGGERVRQWIRRWRPQIITWGLEALVRKSSSEVEDDWPLLDRFARELDEAGITHVLPMLSVLAPFVQRACTRMRKSAQWAVTVQGYELYCYAARRAGIEKEFLQSIRRSIDASPVRPITVSHWYAKRIEREIGIPAERFVIIPPGIPLPQRISDDHARCLLGDELGITDFDTPIICFVGRQDSEKGIDLLLYSIRMLQDQGITTQLVIVGANGFGYSYSDACRQIAGHLSLNVRWKDYVKIEVRNALMQLSDCLVCPSIHGEPFGIVVIEAMSLGTPVIVPNIGGSQEIICRDNLSAGLTFTCHDSGSLCDKLRMLLSNESLRSELGTNGLALVHNWTSELVAERTLSAFLPDLQSGVVEGSAPQACTAQVSATP